MYNVYKTIQVAIKNPHDLLFIQKSRGFSCNLSYNFFINLIRNYNLNFAVLQLERKDAIWFTEKGDDGATSIYSMAEFNFRKELSFYNAYKQCKFGAIPNLEDK